MDDRNERIAAALERLFRTYPQSDRGDVLDVALERMERAKVYLEAVEQYDVRDIEEAAKNLLSGAAPGVNASFLPPAPAVASEVRRVMNLRLDSERRRKALRPALPAPPIGHSPESQARVRELVERTVSGLRTSDEDTPEARYRAQLRKANAYFDAERGYSAGDPEGDEAAA